jgi:hypothetical protein
VAVTVPAPWLAEPQPASAAAVSAAVPKIVILFSFMARELNCSFSID